jgi:pimeloyl-ACP methyl ester carboxylesterase
VHLARPEVDLDVHVLDVLNVLEFEDLRDVVLVGHSYGGMVITGVAERVPERLGQLVYVDAFVPEDGQSLLDLVGPEAAARFEAQARTTGDGWRVPPLPLSPDTPEALRGWIEARRTPQPLRTLQQPVRLRSPAAAALPRSYVSCNTPAMGFFDGVAARLRADPRWRVFELATGHNVQYTMPKELSELLTNLV